MIKCWIKRRRQHFRTRPVGHPKLAYQTRLFPRNDLRKSPDAFYCISPCLIPQCLFLKARIPVPAQQVRSCIFWTAFPFNVCSWFDLSAKACRGGMKRQMLNGSLAYRIPSERVNSPRNILMMLASHISHSGCPHHPVFLEIHPTSLPTASISSTITHTPIAFEYPHLAMTLSKINSPDDQSCDGQVIERVVLGSLQKTAKACSVETR